MGFGSILLGSAERECTLCWKGMGGEPMDEEVEAELGCCAGASESDVDKGSASA